MNFDQENGIEDFLADDEPELSDKKWRFKARVTSMMQKHNLVREDAEEVVETAIRTKETDKRCKCGEVAQYFDKETKEIFCGPCFVFDPRKDEFPDWREEYET